MQALLEQESLDYRDLRRGDVVEGVVMSVDREGVLVDIGSKSEGIIPLNELHSLGAEGVQKLQPGDRVLAYVLQPETSEGQVLLSVDRARGEKGWRVLQQRFEEGESFEAEVTGYNKGGVLVNVEGVNAFVPLSQLVGVRPERPGDGGGSLAQAVGRKLLVKVIEINRRRNRVILSERAALQEWRAQQKERLLSELQEGEIRHGKVTSIRNFGVFVDLGGADGLVHLSELSWERNKSPEDLYRVGQEVDVYVMKVDPETKKIALSFRRAQPEQWERIVDNYHVGQLVTGRVTKLVTFGAFARIDGPVEGLIHVSELVEQRIQHPREVVKEGDILPLRIVRIERDRHRLGLSLRQVREEAESMGFGFNEAGSVVHVPDDVRRDVEERTGIYEPPAEPVQTEPAEAEAPEAAAPAAEAAEAAEPAEVEAPEAEALEAEAPEVEEAPEAEAAEAEAPERKAPAAEAPQEGASEDAAGVDEAAEES